MTAKLTSNRPTQTPSAVQCVARPGQKAQEATRPEHSRLRVFRPRSIVPAHTAVPIHSCVHRILYYRMSFCVTLHCDLFTQKISQLEKCYPHQTVILIMNANSSCNKYYFGVLHPSRKAWSRCTVVQGHLASAGERPDGASATLLVDSSGRTSGSRS